MKQLARILLLPALVAAVRILVGCTDPHATPAPGPTATCAYRPPPGTGCAQ